MKQFVEFPILSGLFVFLDGFQQSVICKDFVLDEVSTWTVRAVTGIWATSGATSLEGVRELDGMN
jgi:hypothetical protein